MMAEPILSAESAKSFRQATATIARLFSTDTSTVGAPARASFSSYIHSSSSARPGAQVLSYSLSINAIINSHYLWSRYLKLVDLKLWSTNALLFLG